MSIAYDMLSTYFSCLCLKFSCCLQVVKIYFLQETQIQIHQTRVTRCPDDFPADYYWYGQKQHSPGQPPWWLETHLDEGNDSSISPELEQLDSLLSPEGDGAESESESNLNQTQGLSLNPNLSLSARRVEFVKRIEPLHLEETCEPL